jgi:hypothetical protein
MTKMDERTISVTLGSPAILDGIFLSLDRVDHDRTFHVAYMTIRTGDEVTPLELRRGDRFTTPLQEWSLSGFREVAGTDAVVLRVTPIGEFAEEEPWG